MLNTTSKSSDLKLGFVCIVVWPAWLGQRYDGLSVCRMRADDHRLCDGRVGEDGHKIQSGTQNCKGDSHCAFLHFFHFSIRFLFSFLINFVRFLFTFCFTFVHFLIRIFYSFRTHYVHFFPFTIHIHHFCVVSKIPQTVFKNRISKYDALLFVYFVCGFSLFHAHHTWMAHGRQRRGCCQSNPMECFCGCSQLASVSRHKMSLAFSPSCR